MFAQVKAQAEYIERISHFSRNELYAELNYMFSTVHNAVQHDDETAVRNLSPLYRILMIEARRNHLIH